MSSEAERAVERVFVVMDPTRMVQPALEKGEWVAKRNNAKLHMYCCIWDADLEKNADDSKALVERTSAWLERLAESLRGQISVTVRVDWAPDWRERIATVAREFDADLIVKTAARHSQFRRQLTRTSDWTLLRNAGCPTLLVEPTQAANTSIVLAAVKLNPEDQAHSVLNERVVSMSHRIARVLDAELHAVTAYKGEGIYFDRQRFADACGLPRNRVHAVEGAPERAIAEVASEIDAGVLIVGCAANQVPERGVIIGDTAQRLIDEVSVDVIVIPAA